MKDIQVDMFEVQLGAAVLLQFKRENGGEVDWISVLADAGVDASGYSEEHVRDKLLQPSTMQTITLNGCRIDLIIGTHYDKDHLAGLVPIIEDQRFEIGEAWLPPVANDTELHAIDDPIDKDALLAFQFSDEAGQERLERYLRKKEEICREMNSLLAMATAQAEGETIELREWILRSESKLNLIDKEPIGEERFQFYQAQADAIIGGDTCNHMEMADPDESQITDLKYMRLYDPRTRYNLAAPENKIVFFGQRWSEDRELVKRDRLSMAYIQRSAAKDAINASSLYKVVTALKKRGIAIRCQVIEDGLPQHYNWNISHRRFMRATTKSTTEPALTLLGPSRGLVKKNWHRLPMGQYMLKLAIAEIPIRNITPSNQLSYVVRFEYAKQGILVVGDAGFVDFSEKKGQYYATLLQALLPLHIVQVAHHGGRNAHFYRVLLRAGYAAQTDLSFLLLSHAEHDKYRPSDEFAQFIEQVRAEGDDISLLFTSEPVRDKVETYRDIIYPVVPASAAVRVGDIRITYTSRDRWQVAKHSIHVS